MNSSPEPSSPATPCPVPNREIPWNSLSDALEGELSLDFRVLEEHSEDASMFRETPQAVAFPKSKKDCESILTFCRQHRISIHPWGAGTSRGGQPLGRGLVVNFRKFMNQIIAFQEETGEITVEPGAYYSEVQKFLRAKGRSFPPDPSYHLCTIGGMIANNAAGIHSVKYGGTVDHVAQVEFLTCDGMFHNSDEPDALSEQVKNFQIGRAHV